MRDNLDFRSCTVIGGNPNNFPRDRVDAIGSCASASMIFKSLKSSLLSAASRMMHQGSILCRTVFPPGRRELHDVMVIIRFPRPLAQLPLLVVAKTLQTRFSLSLFYRTRARLTVFHVGPRCLCPQYRHVICPGQPSVGLKLDRSQRGQA